MSEQSVFFVGSEREVAHHAAPFAKRLNVRIIDADNVVAETKPGDLAIFFSEHFDRFRQACQALKQNNIATLYMIDGILEWRNAWVNRPDEVACPYAMRPVLSHKVACIGNSQARVLQAWGNQGKTEVVGIPRLEALTASTGRQSSRDDGEFRVLVMTAKTPGFTPAQVETVRASLSDLKVWQKNHSQLNGKTVKFIWRLTGGLDAEIGVQNELTDLTGAELGAVLRNVDAVVASPSTAILEAMLLDLPVAVLDYHNCPHYVTAGWDICGQEHIAPTMLQLAEQPETRMLFQRQQLQDALNLAGPTDRLCDLVNSMLRISDERLNAGEALKFPANILPPAEAVSTEFHHSSLYPCAKEFKTDDKALLQVELSHARREIQHLQGELAQIQSELDQAHQIFEQIEQHPIAGPIVRIRQKMLDLMSAIKKRKTKLDTSAVNSPQQVRKVEG